MGRTSEGASHLRRYPAYKDSGVPWLGEIPAHWEVLPISAIARLKSIRGKTERELLSIYLNRGVIRYTDAEEKRTNVTSLDLSRYQAVDPGDFVLNNQQAWRGSVGVSRIEGIVSPAYLVLSLDQCIDPAYADLLFRNRVMVNQYVICSRGVGTIQRNIYWPSLRKSSTILPPPDEQRAIARFLEAIDRLTRRYINAQRRLIALLTEQKQALIQQAVTRGLNPDAPLKDSGIEWLGEIPAHWEALRSKYVFREIDERSATGNETLLSMSQKLGLVPSSQIEERRLLSQSYAGAKLCKTDDLVLNRLKAHLGVFALASEPGIVSPDYTVLRAARSICPRYFELTLRTQACRTELRRRVKGIVQGFWRLYTEEFYGIVLPVPPVNEQQAIVEHLDMQLQSLNDAIARTQRQIDLVREYRTRLIADVVTGKLDVRGVEVGRTSESASHLYLEDETDFEDTIESGDVSELYATEEEGIP